MDEILIPVTAWNDSGNGYGLRLSPVLRDRYFSKEWSYIFLQLEKNKEPVKIKLSPCFWNKCSELRSIEIRKWLFENQLAPWQKSNPPIFELMKGESNFFTLARKF